MTAPRYRQSRVGPVVRVEGPGVSQFVGQLLTTDVVRMLEAAYDAGREEGLKASTATVREQLQDVLRRFDERMASVGEDIAAFNAAVADLEREETRADG